MAPLDRILVETDAPYLTPMPLRGRPNASYLIPHTARFMADVLGLDLDRVCQALNDNADGRLRRGLVDGVRRGAAPSPDGPGVRPGPAGARRGSSTPCSPQPSAHPRPDSPRASRSWCCPPPRTARRTGRRPANRDSRWLRGMRTAPVLILVWTSQEAYLDRYAEPDKGWTDRDLAHWPAPVLVRRRRDGRHGGAAVRGGPGPRGLLLRRPTARSHRPSAAVSGCRTTSSASAWSASATRRRPSVRVVRPPAGPAVPPAVAPSQPLVAGPVFWRVSGRPL